jgi:predicted RNA binding protein YcfA (HicA-like mRNA interferase family)
MSKNLRSKHLRTLLAIFRNPIPKNLTWDEIEGLLLALGAELSAGKGSRVRVYLNKRRAIFHRPHPEKEVDRGALRSLRRFLSEADIDPNDFENNEGADDEER